MRTPSHEQTTVCWALAFAACLLLLPGAALAARAAPATAPDCVQLQELYRVCHRQGALADSVQTCQEAAQEYVARAARSSGKNPQAAQALAELVCSTGCEDGVSGQPAATAQEITEAFCDNAPTAKPQGVKP